MDKFITVSYSFRGTAIQIPLMYNIETAGNTQTIACIVDSKSAPQWLQLRKFDVISLKEKNFYIPLFNEINNEKNYDTVLFIDKVYADIMQTEKLAVKVYSEYAA